MQAVKELGLNVPVVVRLEGTNAEDARSILKESGVSIIPALGMKDAAEKVVNAALNIRSYNMSILVNKDSRVIVQGITGSEGTISF